MGSADPVAGFTIDTFTGREGQAFDIQLPDGGAARLSLSRVTNLRPRRDGDPDPQRREPFSLIFVGPAEFVLPQRIYPFEHAELGAFKLFIVPLGPGTDGVRYEAVFT